MQKGRRRDLVLVEEGLLPDMAQISSADRECYAPAWREEGSPGFAELPQGSQARLREPNREGESGAFWRVSSDPRGPGAAGRLFQGIRSQRCRCDASFQGL